MSTVLFERSGRDRVVAGVCGGLAIRLAVDATLVRLVFAILALAGGAGILLYLALWVYSDGRRRWPAAVLVAVAAATLLSALGFSRTAVIGASLLFAGLAVVLVRGGSLRPGGSLPIAGVVLMMAGAVLFLGRSGASGAFLAPGAIAGALVLVVGPWLWRLAAERTERIRLEERAEVAARIHDSVLQTLALVQRHSGDAARVSAHRAPPGARAAALALRQRRRGGREPRSTRWRDAAADVEELHRRRGSSWRSAGDVPLDDDAGQLVARGARGDDQRREVLRRRRDLRLRRGRARPRVERVRARSRRRLRPRGRRRPTAAGIADSIEARMQRAGGTATIVSAPGEGTEIELSAAAGAPHEARASSSSTTMSSSAPACAASSARRVEIVGEAGRSPRRCR